MVGKSIALSDGILSVNIEEILETVIFFNYWKNWSSEQK